MLNATQNTAVARRPSAAPSVRNLVTHLLMVTCNLQGIRVQGDRPLIEYGIDSVRAVELIVELEQQFQIDIPDEDAFQLRTLNNVINYVQSRVV